MEQNLNNHVFNEDDMTQNLDTTTEIRFAKKDHPEGKMVPVPVEGREEFILIPLDIKDGDTIKISGRGKRNPRTGETGDLYVLVHIEEKKFPWKWLLVSALLVLAVVAAFIGLKKPTPVDQPVPESTAASCAHNWIPADCTNPKTCSICGEVSGTALGHQWSDATYNAPKTCKICGATEGAKKEPSTLLGLRDIISRASASSVYEGDTLGEHGPENLYDGKLDTNWAEDAPGNGIGEYVLFSFNGTYAVNKLHIYIGSHLNKDYFKKNCRPKVISLTFSDGSTERIQLEDSYAEQTITLKQYYYTDSVRLTIEDVYPGTKYMDTVIAELDFAAYKP